MKPACSVSLLGPSSACALFFHLFWAWSSARDPPRASSWRLRLAERSTTPLSCAVTPLSRCRRRDELLCRTTLTTPPPRSRPTVRPTRLQRWPLPSCAPVRTCGPATRCPGGVVLSAHATGPTCRGHAPRRRTGDDRTGEVVIVVRTAHGEPCQWGRSATAVAAQRLGVGARACHCRSPVREGRRARLPARGCASRPRGVRRSSPRLRAEGVLSPSRPRPFPPRPLSHPPVSPLLSFVTTTLSGIPARPRGGDRLFLWSPSIRLALKHRRYGPAGAAPTVAAVPLRRGARHGDGSGRLGAAGWL